MKHFKNFLFVVLSLCVAVSLAACNKTTAKKVQTTVNQKVTTEVKKPTTAKPETKKPTTKSTSKVTEQFVPSVSYTGSENGDFVYDQAKGVYTLDITLAQWENISIVYNKAEDSEITLWYNTCTVSGDVTASDVYGCDWTSKLYHEKEQDSDVEIIAWYCGVATGAEYIITFNPTENTLVIALYIEEQEGDEPKDETFANADFVAKHNQASDKYAVVYDSSYEGTITLGDYTIATNADGKIIFASRTSGGYGGPSDGFYHDGTYAWTAGQVCGIFNIDANFVPWYSDYTGGDPTPWSLYSVVCPTGYHIITGSQASMTKLIKLVTGVTTFAEENNSLFENNIVDGSLNNLVLTYENGTCCTGIAIDEVEVPKVLTASTAGTIITAMAKNEETGVWTGVYKLTGWNSISFTYGSDVIWYDNTTVSGDVTAVGTNGCSWNQELYHEDSEGKKWFHYGDIADSYYKFEYNPTLNTLGITQFIPGVSAETAGTQITAFAEADGVWSAAYTLSGWQSIKIFYCDENGNKVAVWYDNTTVSGDVVDSETYDCQWDIRLFQEEATPKAWVHTENVGPTSYTFVYNPTAGNLVISKFVAGMVVTGGTVVNAFEETDGVYTGTYTLAEWNSIALSYVNESGACKTIWYDNTTISGAVSAVDVEGCDWTANIFHEGTNKAWLHNGYRATDYYIFAYNPTANTLVVTQYVPGVVATTAGTEVTAFALADGVYTGVYKLTGWNSIALTYTDTDGNSKTIWYDNTDISGDVSSEKTEGCVWTELLFHEETTPKAWVHYEDTNATSYTFTYNPTANTLNVAVKVETFDKAKFVGKLNNKQTVYGRIYDSTYEGTITLGDYTIATNADGKIIFASRTSGGYGGPADGFYHDGTYSWTAGQVCGIFNLEDTFAAWTPNYEGESPVPWQRYSIVCPTGYHIITGTQAQLTQLVKYLTGVAEFNEENNALFETTTVNGALNNCTLTFTNGEAFCGVRATKDVAVAVTGGNVEVAMAKDTNTGKWVGIYSLTEWNSISLTCDGIAIWYDNTTISGAVSGVNVEGCDWTANIFHEGTNKAWLHNGERSADWYKFEYDPEECALVVTQFIPGVSAETAGTAVSAFVEADGVWSAAYTLSGWQSIKIFYCDENGNKVAVWYDNTTVSGDVVDSETYDCQWDIRLFQEEATPKAWVHTENVGPTSYTFVYNPTAGTLVITIVTE